MPQKVTANLFFFLRCMPSLWVMKSKGWNHTRLSQKTPLFVCSCYRVYKDIKCVQVIRAVSSYHWAHHTLHVMSAWCVARNCTLATWAYMLEIVCSEETVKISNCTFQCDFYVIIIIIIIVVVVVVVDQIFVLSLLMNHLNIGWICIN